MEKHTLQISAESGKYWPTASGSRRFWSQEDTETGSLRRTPIPSDLARQSAQEPDCPPNLREPRRSQISDLHLRVKCKDKKDRYIWLTLPLQLFIYFMFRSMCRANQMHLFFATSCCCTMVSCWEFSSWTLCLCRVVYAIFSGSKRSKF